MPTLHLVYPEKGDVIYRIDKFPDGQRNVTILGSNIDHDYIREGGVTIKSRLNNFEDLGIIVAATASLRNLGVKNIELYVPYFLGARSDRKFEEGGNHYLKQVICPIINAQKFSRVTVLDGHSHVLEACLDNYKNVSSTHYLVVPAVRQIKELTKCVLEDIVIVCPDAGASHRINSILKELKWEKAVQVIICSKERATDGTLTKTFVPLEQVKGTKPCVFLIIDDICDGGRTFINIAKEIKTGCYKAINLAVTHGIFSNGCLDLRQFFDKIYSTNSYADDISKKTYNWGENVAVREENEDFITQFNIF